VKIYYICSPSAIVFGTVTARLLWQKSVQSIENTVTYVTLVIAPFLASRLLRNRSASFHWTSLDSLARGVQLPLHTFVRILHNKNSYYFLLQRSYRHDDSVTEATNLDHPGLIHAKTYMSHLYETPLFCKNSHLAGQQIQVP